MNSLCSICRMTLRQLTTSSIVLKWTPASQLRRGHKNKNSLPKFDHKDEDLGEEQWSVKVNDPKPERLRRPRIAEFKDLPPSMRSKFRLFEDESEEVLDSAQYQWEKVEAREETPLYDEFEGLSLERGKTGVFDIHELVNVFRVENAEDVYVVSIPPELLYADYLVLVSGRSSRHLTSMAQFLAKYYKAKKHDKDPFLKNSIAGWNSEWISLDFGNIVVHFMDKKLRKIYDIESLWAVGPDHDAHCQKPKDPTLQLVESSSRIMDGSQPLRKKSG